MPQPLEHSLDMTIFQPNYLMNYLRFQNYLTKFFLTNKAVLYKHQYGFRPKHTTIHPIIHLLNHCASSTSKTDPEFTLAVLCDISKAFDVIDHDLLLRKLNNYDIHELTNKWFKKLSFKERAIRGNWWGKKSQLALIQIGVPQGSILGPLLYLILWITI